MVIFHSYVYKRLPEAMFTVVSFKKGMGIMMFHESFRIFNF